VEVDVEPTVVAVGPDVVVVVVLPSSPQAAASAKSRTTIQSERR
jgi:hypothetical protein